MARGPGLLPGARGQGQEAASDEGGVVVIAATLPYAPLQQGLDVIGLPVARLRPPPSSPANLDREETRADFPYSFRGFAEVGCNTRRAGSAERAALSAPVSSLDFRGERLRQRPPSGCSVYATVAHLSPRQADDAPRDYPGELHPSSLTRRCCTNQPRRASARHPWTRPAPPRTHRFQNRSSGDRPAMSRPIRRG